MVERVGEGPALGGDFQDFGVRICEVEENFRGGVAVTLEANAVIHFLGWQIAIFGAGFEGAEDVAEGERGGCGFEFGIEVGGDPVAEIGGANGDEDRLPPR